MKTFVHFLSGTGRGGGGALGHTSGILTVKSRDKLQDWQELNHSIRKRERTEIIRNKGQFNQE